MPDFKTENLNWLDNLASLETQLQKTPSWTNDQLAKALNLSPSLIGYLRALKTCFDPAAIEKVRLAAKADPPFVLSYNCAKALARLIPRPKGSKGKEAKTPDLTAFHATLDIALSRQLAAQDIEALVEWMKAGNSPETFQESETGKKGKTDKGKNKDENQSITAYSPDDLYAKVMAIAEQIIRAKDRNDTKTTHPDELKALLKKVTEKAEKDDESDKKDNKKSKSASDTNTVWKWIVGISFFKQLRKKVNKGEDLTVTEKCFILLYRLYQGSVWVAKKLWKHLLEPGVKATGRLLKAIFGKGISKVMEWAIPILFICFLIWGLGKVYQYVIVNPLHWAESKVRSGFHWGGTSTEESVSPAPAASSTVLAIPTVPQTVRSSKLGNSRLKTSHSKLLTANSTSPAASYQPAVSFNTTASPLNPTATLYDPKILDSEIQSLPANYVVVKDYPMTPDESMPGDVAVSRMQDLIDPDKYTMMIGSSKQTISIANPTHTTLTIYFKSADLFGPLGGSKSPMNFLWEDVKYIHANEIDVETKNPSVICQCSLVVSGSKYPLTIQCASAEDLEHLVSTMQYFIRSSRLAHDTALGGMPYLHQGLVLNDHWVEKLWAGSPMDKAGVRLGDLIWSLDKDTQSPQDAKKILALLASLAGGNHQLFIYSPADPNNNGVERNEFHTGNFNPKRRKVILTAY